MKALDSWGVFEHIIDVKNKENPNRLQGLERTNIELLPYGLYFVLLQHGKFDVLVLLNFFFRRRYDAPFYNVADIIVEKNVSGWTVSKNRFRLSQDYLV